MSIASNYGPEYLQTETCFKVPGNTFGILWWFGPPEGPIDPEDIHDTEVTSASPEELCTGILPLDGDDGRVEMKLAVRPYAGKYLDGTIFGYGSEHDFLFEWTACGYRGRACCPPDADAACLPGALCDEQNICQPCGFEGEQCCEGNDACYGRIYGGYPDLVCLSPTVVEGASPTGGDACVGCGRAGEPCCSAGEEFVGEWCSLIGNGHMETGQYQTICRNYDPSTDRGTCDYCGGPNQSCCPPSTTYGRGTCNDGLECQQGACVGPNTPDTAEFCNEPVDDAGKNEAAEYLINVGRTDGIVRFEFDTIYAEDEITLLDYGTGNPIVSTGCVSTIEMLSSTIHAHGCENQITSPCCVTDYAVEPAVRWCCSEWDNPDFGARSTKCSVEYAIPRSSNFIKVDVNPTCLDDDDTDWWFKVHCAK